MRTVICSIFDKATHAYMRPFQAQAVGQAIRMFEDLVRDPQTEVGKHREDYTLFHIGYFHDNSGQLEPIEPVPLRRGQEVKDQKTTDEEMH